jgi:hypothetical protein
VFDNSLLSGLIHGSSKPLAPLVVGLDGDFGKSVLEALENEVRSNEELKAILTCKINSLDDSHITCNSSKFRQSYCNYDSPLPAWTAIATSDEEFSEKKISEIIKQTSGVKVVLCVSINCCGLSREKQKEKTQKIINILEKLPRNINNFIMAYDNGKHFHSLVDISHAFVVYFLQAWRRYQESGDCYNNLPKSMNLSGDFGDIYSLGVGRVSVDAKYHAEQIRVSLAEETYKGLFDSPPRQPTGIEYNLENTIEDIIPSSSLNTISNPETPFIYIQGKKVGIVSKSLLHLANSSFHLSRIPEFIMKLKKRESFNNIIEKPTQSALIQMKVKEWGKLRSAEWIKEGQSRAVSSHGILSYYNELFSKWEAFWLEIDGARLGKLNKTRLSTDLKELVGHISRIPAPGSIISRSVLILIAYLWLCFGLGIAGLFKSVFGVLSFGSFPHKWMWIYGTIMILIPMAGAGLYYQAMKTCDSIADRIIRNIEERHITKILRFIKKSLSTVAISGIKDLQKEKSKYEQFIIEIKALKEEGKLIYSTDEKIINCYPDFKKDSLQGLVSPKLRSARDEALTKFVDRLHVKIGNKETESGFWDIGYWAEVLNELSRESATNVIKKITIEEAFNSSKLSVYEHIGSVLSFAKYPALPNQGMAGNTSAFIFIPPSWEPDIESSLRTHNTTIVIHHSDRRDLLAVAPIHISTFLYTDDLNKET